jgi:preprotein translocase subunit SecD
MARSSARPGRTVAVFFIGLAVAYGLVALIGTWKPALGLDLKGGTQITLIANGNVKKDQLNEAADIIDARVNGSGVSEAEVTTQGSNEIVVQVPGSGKNSKLVETVVRQARLRFRLVAQVAATATPQTPPPSGSASASSSPTPGVGVTLPPSDGTKSSTPNKPRSSSTGKNRTPALLGKNKSGSKTATASPTSSPTSSPSASAKPEPSTSDVKYTAANVKAYGDALAWMASPDPQSVAVYNAYTCPSKTQVVDDPNIPIVTCDAQKDPTTGQYQKYLLSPALIEGTDITSASAGAPGSSQGQVQWSVNLQLKNPGSDEQLKLSRAMAGTNDQFAIVLDGQVISAPTFQGVIPNGTSQITGNFTENEAKSLATSLKYGALPINFDKTKTTIQVIGPSLAGDQLSAGITAGIAGLVLVMIYCLLYYRGLGLVVIASLIVAGVTTYAMVLLLAKSAGFTLTLPGIAGLIVAVGITADSFIVFFERIRDEMRSGKSMRVAVEAGWIRARATCVAADAVSILAAVVLYIFAAGVVKGFAFALGLSTLIDLAVFFWFTKPMVSWLARFPFFNKGHRLSGLDAENLGLDRLPAGGRA